MTISCYKEIDNQNHPIFSVVTVVFNDAEGLAATAKTVLEQDFKSFEWIVIDGGSTDGTVEILRSLSVNNLSYVSEQDDGVYDAMNKGIVKSRGDYLVFMNAGDFFSQSNILSVVWDKIAAYEKKPDVILGGANLVFDTRRKVYRGPKKLESRIWHGLPAVHQATYYRTSLISRTHYDLSYKICGDYYLIAKLASNGVESVCIDKPLAEFMAGSGIAHNNKVRLFMEPYRIQKEVLNKCLFVRLFSVLKRILGVTAVAVLRSK